MIIPDLKKQRTSILYYNGEGNVKVSLKLMKIWLDLKLRKFRKKDHLEI